MDKDTASALAGALSIQASNPSPATIIPQDSPLLNLPGEIKNRIFELVHPSGNTIILSAHKQAAGTKTTYHFSPASPPLSAVCRQLRAEFPIARYYATNTFVITEALFRLDVFTAFVAGRLPAIDHLRIARVVRLCTITTSLHIPSSRFSLLVKADMGPDGIRVDRVTTSGQEHRESLYSKPLHDLIKSANTGRLWGGPKTLITVLKLYSRACADIDSRTSRDYRIAALHARRLDALRDRKRAEFQHTPTYLRDRARRARGKDF